jgi:hypothetical protein
MEHEWKEGTQIRSQTSSSAPYVNPDLQTLNPRPDSFNRDDWSFLRVKPGCKEDAKCQKEFLEFLHSNKTKKPAKGHFFIELNIRKAGKFMRNFKGKHIPSIFHKTLEYSADVRNAQYYKILLEISDSKINLGKYPIFFELKEAMATKIESTHQGIEEEKKKSLIELIDNVTKVTQLLMISVLSFYGKHEQEFKNEVKDHLSFIKQLWFRLERGEVQAAWEQKAHDYLKFRTNIPRSRTADRFGLSWNFVNHWIEKNKLHLTKMKAENFHRDTVVEIVNKLIFYSNHKTITDSIEQDLAEGK